MTGKLVSVGDKRNNWLNVESFKYYLQMPGYIYPKNETIAKFGFMTFVGNSVIVIGFAMIAQVILCSRLCLCNQQTSDPKSRKSGIDVFYGGHDGAVCEYYASAAVMYREMGAYNNYASFASVFISVRFLLYTCTKDFFEIRFLQAF